MAIERFLVVKAPVQAALAIAPDAMAAAGVKVQSVAGETVRARKSMTLTQWGQDFEFTFRPSSRDPIGETEIYVEADQYGVGANRRLSKMLDKIESEFASRIVGAKSSGTTEQHTWRPKV